MTWAWILVLAALLYPLSIFFCIVDVFVWIIKNDWQWMFKPTTHEEDEDYVQHVFEEICKERSKRSCISSSNIYTSLNEL